MQDQEQQVKIAAKIEEAKSVLVALSKDPSVDEISAALGLAMLLDSMGKHVTAIYSGKTPNALKFLKPEKTFEASASSLQDFIIALSKDKADHLRYKVEGDFVKIYITPYKAEISEKDLEFSHGDFNVDLIIAVDVKDDNDLDAALIEHGRIMHDAGTVNISIEKPGRFAEISWCETDASSVCELVARMTEHFKAEVKLTPEVATALLTGIVANTNRFMNEKTTPKVMNVASKLMAAGANQVLISQNVAEEGKMAEKEEEPEKKPEKDKSEEAKELDELAALAVSAAEESAEKMPGKVPDTEPRLEIKEEETAEKKEEKVEEGPKEEEKKSEEKKSDEEALEEALEHIGESGGKSVDVMGELKEMAGEAGAGKKDEGEKKTVEKNDGGESKVAAEKKDDEGEKVAAEKGDDGEKKEKKEEEGGDKPLMGAVKLDEMDSPKDRPDTTGLRGVMDLEKMRGGVVLTEEMTAGDVLGDESAAASEKVLAAEIYPDIHKVPEDVKEIKPRRVDYGSMMEEALTEQTQSLADSPIAAAPVGQGAPSLQDVAAGLAQGGAQKQANDGTATEGVSVKQGGIGGSSGLNPAAQMAPQVMNQPEANHIPAMEYVPDGSAQNEGPAQMGAGFLGTPTGGTGSANEIQVGTMGGGMMGQQMTPQEMAMQVMDQMGPTQQQEAPVMTPMTKIGIGGGKGKGIGAGTPEVSLPVAPAPPVDITQMMPPQDGQGSEPAGGASGDAGKDGMTAGQLYQKNDPSAFHIPGM